MLVLRKIFVCTKWMTPYYIYANLMHARGQISLLILRESERTN